MALRQALALQEAQDPRSTGLFRQALEAVESQAMLAERRAAAASLWPERPPLSPHERLDAIDELALLTEEFRLFLDRLEQRDSGR
jgi:hypothetical protein